MVGIWITAHRNLFLGVIGLSVWMFANFWYLRTDIRRIRAARKPHVWGVDMAAKTSTGGRTKNIQ